MEPIQWIVLGVGIILSGVCLYFANASYYRAGLIKDIPTSSIGSIKKPGYYEIKGQILCEQPLELPEVKGKKLVWYDFRVEEKVKYWNSSTKSYSHKWQTAEHRTDWCPLHLKDGSGQIMLNLKEGEIEGEELFSRTFHKQQDLMSFIGNAFNIGFGGNVVAHRVTIYGIRANSRLYVLGSCVKKREGLCFADNSKEERPFIVSTKSEEDLVSSKQSSGILLIVASLAIFIITLIIVFKALAG
ncbi:GIDE domain-containing protein [Candidatus Riflebacteria bacterium]